MITRQTNVILTPSPEGLALIEALNTARLLANASDPHSHQQGTYGAVETVLLGAIQKELLQQPEFLADEALLVAECLLNAALDGGENITYCINLWNTDQITVEA